MARTQDKIIGFVILGFVAVMALIVILTLVNLSMPGDVDFPAGGDKVAVIELNGIITSSRSIVRQFKRYEDDNSVKAIVFRIDSPGGGIAASQEIYAKVRSVRDAGKPIVASMGSVAASGGYYVALGADSIMAVPGTTTGSIGVIAEFPDFTQLLDKLGIEMNIIKSGRFKDTGTPYRDLTPRDREYLQEWINSGYEQFVAAVAEERQMDEDRVKELADGRVYSGQQAYELALIDTLGTFEDAIHLAARAGGIEGEPRIVREERQKLTPFELLFSFDVKAFVETYLSAWPRVQYKMFF